MQRSDSVRLPDWLVVLDLWHPERGFAPVAVPVTAERRARFWEVAPGVLGRWPNPEGRARLDALCAPYLATP